MKIGRLQIWWEKKDKDLISWANERRRLSRLDRERIEKYINGGYHIHKNPRKKALFNLPPSKEDDKCQPETCAGQCQGMNSRPECPNVLNEEDESHAALPRHTPEKLDRLIEKVRE